MLAVPDEAPSDCTVVVDMSPHAGDKSLGYNAFQQSLGRGHSKGKFYYIALAYGSARSAGVMGLLFSERRIAKELAKDWMSERLELKDKAGNVVKPVTTTPELTETELERVPGAATAWRGVGNIPFEACEIVGSQVEIKASWVTEMATAPNQVAQQFLSIKAEHQKLWQGMLSPFLQMPSPEEPEVDPAPEADPEPAVDLSEWESLESLTAEVNIIQQIRAAEYTLLMDDKHNVYGLDPSGSRTVAKYTFVGGFGGGSLVNASLDVASAIPFTLPDGDKSIVQLTKLPDEDSSSKPTTGTLFSVLRSLEMKGYHDIEITKYGKAKPETENGQRCYKFPDMKAEENFDYVLNSNSGTIKVDNFFKTGANAP